MKTNNTNKSHFYKLSALVVLAVVAWRISMLLISSQADLFLTYQPTFPYSETLLLSRNLPKWLVSWANFDGVHYLTITEKGYLGTGLIQAFFPVYPLLVAVVSQTSLDLLLSGLLLSNVFFVGFVLLLFWYVLNHSTQKQAWWTIAVLLLFPTSFYFGAMYTESLFLLLVLASLWLGQEKKWLLAGLVAGLASGTRLVGIFLLPALVFEFIQQRITHKSVYTWQFWISEIKKNPTFIVGLFLGSLGLVSYMLYLHVTFNDPLFFYHVQDEFGGGRQESLVLLPQVFWRYAKIIATYKPIGLQYLIYLQELLFTLFSYVILFLAAQKVRWSWTLFALLAVTLPTLTGTFSSMPRYILVALPLFIFLGKKMADGHSSWKIWLLIATSLLLCNTILFIQGYWVA